MSRQALVMGAGVAGLSSARLLARQGWDVTLHGEPSRCAPVLVLNAVTCGLLADLWGDPEDLLAGAHPIARRGVRWGAEKPAFVEQPAAVIRGDLLAARLFERLLAEDPQVRAGSPEVEKPSWIVDARGRASRSERRSLGRRQVICREVSWKGEWDCTWMEAAPEGWVFRAPLGQGRAVLQTMTLDPQAPSDAFVLDAAPQISDPLCGPGRIRVGDAAVSLDPICGDGTGWAIRGALLAAGALEGIESGLPEEECLRHYDLRLRKAFLAHLEACLGFYTSGSLSPAWEVEVDLMRRALADDEGRKYRLASLSYGLERSRLVPLSRLEPVA